MASLYEACVIFRALPRSSFMSAVEGVCRTILSKGGVVRDAKTVGELDLPYKMKNDMGFHTSGRPTFVQFDVGASALDDLRMDLKNNSDVVRFNIIKMPNSQTVKCRFDKHGKAAEPYRKAQRKSLEQQIQQAAKQQAALAAKSAKQAQSS